VGRLTLPPSGSVAVDANVVIYAVQGDSAYEPLLRPLWRALWAGSITVVCSELLLCEVLTGALKNDDARLAEAFEAFLASPGWELLPISREILRNAARLRASLRLRTPDAIHAATALRAGCAMFLTNDPHFRRVPDLPVTILDEVLAA